MTKLFAILIFMLSFLNIETESTLTNGHYCWSNSITYRLTSAYKANLNLLLESLSSHANSSDGFFNTSEGKPGDVDSVYGSFLCRGDAIKDVCVECVTNASVRIKEICPMAKVAILWFDECMLRYSDRNFLSGTDKSPLLIGYDPANVKEAAEFMKLLNKTMNQLITLATECPDKKFAFKEAYFKSWGTSLYTFFQCRPDISAAHWEYCLQNATSSLLAIQTGKIGGTILLPSCFVIFKIYPFYTNVSKAKRRRLSSTRLVVGTTSAIWAVVLICVLFYFTLKREWNKRNHVEEDPLDESKILELHSLQYDVCAIMVATAYFSNHNKLGEGGFGPVYRGTLPCGREIAAKRLSQTSRQGVQEFKNEFELVSKLQHRNIVKLLGFSMERDEMIIVYEYVPNGSLDQLLFDPQQSKRLDWSARQKIMVGVAHGLLYLHEDSRLRIIHRDLKASNILLDDDMNPKISDFGMARSLGVELTQRSTKRIAGTYGYMSPEYVMYGQFSAKSDVFSFGVLMLEIITGKKNRYSYVLDRYVCLLDHVWEHWRIGALLEIVDPTISESYSKDEVIRCIHIGLLCVQNDKENRPSMDEVIIVLSTADSVNLPVPDQPTFIIPSINHKQEFRDRASNKLNRSEIIKPCSIISNCVSDVAPR